MLNEWCFIYLGLFKRKCFNFCVGAYWLGLLKLNREAFPISAFEGVRFLVCAHIPSHVDISHIFRKKNKRNVLNLRQDNAITIKPVVDLHFITPDTHSLGLTI